MIPFNVWTKSPNTITIFPDNFAEELDSFELLFVSRIDCKEVVLPVTKVVDCAGRITFSFSVDCELEGGVWDITLTNTTKAQTVFEACPSTVFDIPNECVKNPL
jgi:hypothetical protein